MEQGKEMSTGDDQGTWHQNVRRQTRAKVKGSCANGDRVALASIKVVDWPFGVLDVQAKAPNLDS